MFDVWPDKLKIKSMRFKNNIFHPCQVVELRQEFNSIRTVLSDIQKLFLKVVILKIKAN